MQDHDIFIYHLDAELLKLYINPSRYNPKTVEEVFSCVLKIAFLLCGANNHLLIPASHFFESDIAYNNLSFFSSFLEDDLIHLLSQSGNFQLFLEKKMEQHEGHISAEQFHYKDYYKNDNGLYLPGSYHKREKSSSKEIRKNWLSSIGNKDIWDPYYEMIDYSDSYSVFEEKLGKIPERLGKRAYISEYIVPLMELNPKVHPQTDRFLNAFITKEYIKNYLLEYENATALKDIPFIDSNEILPQIPERQYISYIYYERRLGQITYHDMPAIEYIKRCSAHELKGFKSSLEWLTILNDPGTENNNRLFGGIKMAKTSTIKTVIFFALPEELAPFMALVNDCKKLDPDIEKQLGIMGHIGKITCANSQEHEIAIFLLPEYGNNMASMHE